MNYFNIDDEAKPNNKMQLNVAMGQREHEPTQGGRRNQRALRAELKLGAISILTSPNQVVVPLGSEAPRNSRSREAKLVQSGDALARRRERDREGAGGATGRGGEEGELGRRGGKGRGEGRQRLEPRHETRVNDKDWATRSCPPGIPATSTLDCVPQICTGPLGF